jgi:hypothetical protein
MECWEPQPADTTTEKTGTLRNLCFLTMYRRRLQRNGRNEANTSTSGGQVVHLQLYRIKEASYAGVDTSDLNMSNIRTMFDAAGVTELIIPGEHNQRVDQLKWQTMVYRVRKKLKRVSTA